MTTSRGDDRESRPDGDDRRPPRSAPRSGGTSSNNARAGGDRKPYQGGRSASSGERRPYQGDRAGSSGERRPYQGDRPASGERRPYQGDRPASGERRPYQGDRKQYQGDRPASGERRPYQGDRKPYQGDRPASSGERRPYQGDRPASGERRPYQGDRKPYQGDRPASGERRPYQGDRSSSSGERKPWVERGRDGNGKPSAGRRPGADRGRDGAGYPAGDRKPWVDRKPGADRNGPGRPGSRPARPAADDRDGPPRIPAPPIPEAITPFDLAASARNELKTLSKENAEQVARHLAMASKLIDEDPALAHEHALAATRSAGRIAIVRETAAITAYAIGDYALALRELRTYRRISGNDDQIALMVDSERGVGRSDRALEVGRAVDRSTLPVGVRVELAIAMSGAHLDLGETERALQELDIPELNPDLAFEWSPALFAAQAAVLEELGRTDEAEKWQHRADVAADALGAVDGADASSDEVIVIEEIEFEDEDEDEDEDEVATDAEADSVIDGESPDGAVS